MADEKPKLTAEDFGLTQAVYSPEEFAKLVNRSRSWAWVLIRNKKIGTIRTHGRTYIPRPDAVALFNAEYQPATSPATERGTTPVAA